MYWIGFVFAFALMVGCTLYKINVNKLLRLKDIALLIVVPIFSWVALLILLVGSIIVIFENKDVVVWRKK